MESLNKNGRWYLNASLSSLSHSDNRNLYDGKKVGDFIYPDVQLKTGICAITKPEHIIFSRGANILAKDIGIENKNSETSKTTILKSLVRFLAI